jgi:predicted nucleotidyltransferase
MSPLNNSVLKKIKESIKKIDPLATAILFGSRATRHFKKDSDWDILILIDKPVNTIKDEQLFRHNLYDIELETGEAISTFVYDIKYWKTMLSSTPLYKAVEQNGIIL